MPFPACSTNSNPDRNPKIAKSGRMPPVFCRNLKAGLQVTVVFQMKKQKMELCQERKSLKIMRRNPGMTELAIKYKIKRSLLRIRTCRKLRR